LICHPLHGKHRVTTQSKESFVIVAKLRQISKFPARTHVNTLNCIEIQCNYEQKLRNITCQTCQRFRTKHSTSRRQILLNDKKISHYEVAQPSMGKMRKRNRKFQSFALTYWKCTAQFSLVRTKSFPNCISVVFSSDIGHDLCRTYWITDRPMKSSPFAFRLKCAEKRRRIARNLSFGSLYHARVYPMSLI